MWKRIILSQIIFIIDDFSMILLQWRGRTPKLRRYGFRISPVFCHWHPGWEYQVKWTIHSYSCDKTVLMFLQTMYWEALSINELITTGSTFMRLLSGMRATMYSQTASACKCFTTNITFKWLFYDMSTWMSDKAPPFCEPSPTLSALILLNCLWYGSGDAWTDCF